MTIFVNNCLQKKFSIHNNIFETFAPFHFQLVSILYNVFSFIINNSNIAMTKFEVIDFFNISIMQIIKLLSVISYSVISKLLAN